MMQKLTLFIATLKIILNAIINNKILLLGTTLVLYGSFILIFTFIYYFIQSYQMANITYYKGKALQGFTIPMPAFMLVGDIRQRLEIKAKNDLLLSSFAGDSTNIHWQSLNQDRSLQRQFPKDAKHWDDFKDNFVRGVTPTKLVEGTFAKYGVMQFKIDFYRDNIFTSLFPIHVMSEYLEKSPPEVEKQIRNQSLNPVDNQIAQKLFESATIFRNHFLKENAEGKLFELNFTLKGEVEKYFSLISESKRARFKNIFYGAVLNVMAPPSTVMKFNFDELVENPSLMDFFYLSSMIATNNTPADILPLTNGARFVVWFQIILSYFLLALLVAVFLKFFNLS